jgi:hypothetical protein
MNFWKKLGFDINSDDIIKEAHINIPRFGDTIIHYHTKVEEIYEIKTKDFIIYTRSAFKDYRIIILKSPCMSIIFNENSNVSFINNNIHYANQTYKLFESKSLEHLNNKLYPCLSPSYRYNPYPTEEQRLLHTKKNAKKIINKLTPKSIMIFNYIKKFIGYSELGTGCPKTFVQLKSIVEFIKTIDCEYSKIEYELEYSEVVAYFITFFEIK